MFQVQFDAVPHYFTDPFILLVTDISMWWCARNTILHNIEMFFAQLFFFLFFIFVSRNKCCWYIFYLRSQCPIAWSAETKWIDQIYILRCKRKINSTVNSLEQFYWTCSATIKDGIDQIWLNFSWGMTSLCKCVHIVTATTDCCKWDL